MRVFRTITKLLLLLLLIFFAGDFLNFPLWPIDWLIPSFPIEVRIAFEGIDSDAEAHIFRRPELIHLNLCETNGEVLRRLKVDDRGIARLVIREGRYAFSATVPVVEKGQLHFYAYPSGETNVMSPRKIKKSDSIHTLLFRKSNDFPENSINSAFKMFLLLADYESASAFSDQISADYLNDLQALQSIQETLVDLPLFAYNSIIENLSTASHILSRYNIEPHRQILKLNSEVIYIESRLRAIQDARNKVILQYLDLIHDYHASGYVINVLEEWNQLINNPEIYREDMINAAMFSADIEAIEPIIDEIAVLVPDEIEAGFQTAVEAYNSGDLVDARSRFTKLMTFLRNLHSGSDYDELEFTVLEYIEDVEIINAANHAVRSDQLEKALHLYDLVTRPNDLVRERLRDTENLMQLRFGGKNK